jgi:DNA-binding Lrp family transcriptional regulator
MPTITAPDSVTLDHLDRQIIHALIADGRCPFSRIAEVIGSSEQTVARRYRRMRELGVIRVRGLRAPAEGMEDWWVRVQVRPGSAGAVAGALAARDDVSWVNITAGGAEVVCSTRPRTPQQRDALLLERLPRAGQVTSLTANAILHRYAGSGENEWTGFDDPLEPDQIDAITAGRGPRPAGVITNPTAPRPRITPADTALADALHDDGRASYAQLAAITGSSPGQVARRLEGLFATGALYVDTEVATEPLGISTIAMLWLSVAPSGLVESAERLAAAPESAFVAAVSGPANLHVSVACRGVRHLYEFLVREVGALSAVQTVETSPIVRRVKQAGSIMRGGRLPEPV